MKQLTPDAIARLVKLLGMLGSAHDGERAAAAWKANELVRRHGLQWSDIVVTTPPAIGWREKVRACEAHLYYLNSAEVSFVRSMSNWEGTPSPRQLAWLDRIFENLP